MEIKHIVADPPYCTNSFILTEGDDLVVIDPAADFNEYSRYDIGKMKILLTHGHFDHVTSVEQLRMGGAKLFMSREDAAHFEMQPDEFLKDGDKIMVGKTELCVLSTPGHTPGSLCFYTMGHLFAGDTLFYHNCGRCDLPGGDYSIMLKSLKRLSELPSDTTVYPGHESFGNIGDERKHNPYMKEAL